MMLFKLSLKNIRKSMKDYAVYFFTLIIGVSVFYVFNSIESQTVMLNVSASTYEIIEMMINTLSGMSVFVSFVLGLLIIFASRFLMKRRNKEFGIYLLLGMGKRRISMILFLETLFIGVISLAVGLGLGVCLSQLMSLLVANMFDADMSGYAFVFSGSACAKTAFYFGLMYLFVMIFNTVNVSRCKLIDLIQAGKRTEKVKMKNPWVCTVVFLISAAVLGYAYYYVTVGVTVLTSDMILKIILMGSVSTFFIIWSLSGLILKLVMASRGLYYKGLNSFVLRQVSSQINTMVASMTVICLMLFVTICMLSSALSIKNSMNANLEELAPLDIEMSKRMNMDETWLEQGYTQKQIENSGLGILETYEAMGTDLTQYFSEYYTFPIYCTEKLTMKDTLGDSLEMIRENYPYMMYDTQEDIVALSDYNRVAELFGYEQKSLEEDEYFILADFDSIAEIRNWHLQNSQNGAEIEVFGHRLKPKYRECQYGTLQMAANHINSGVFVVPDSAVDPAYIQTEVLLADYAANTKEGKQEIENTIDSLEKFPEDYNMPSVDSRIKIGEATTGIGALVTFIGLYLGIVFLITSAAILALKELSDSADNVERYHMLRKLGVDEKMIHHALFWQIGIFFLAPLLLAGVHSVFGMKFAGYILETFGQENLLPSIAMAGGVLAVIYGGYFLLTYFSSRNIIRERD